MSEHAVITEIRRIAAERPDYVYQFPASATGCFYVHDGKPSCLVGHALWNLGILKEEPSADDTSIANIASDIGLDLPPEQLQWAATVQAEQDKGVSWGKAVAAADAAR